MEFQKINLTSYEPLYMQISNAIEQKITSKKYSVGNKLPPEEELRKTFNVSRYTVREAMLKLVNEGYISRRQNHGTFVISSEPNRYIDLKRKNEISIVVYVNQENNTGTDVFSDTRVYRIIRGMEEKAREKGLFLIHATIRNSELSLKGKEKDIAGLVVAGEGGIRPEQLRVIKNTKIPFVLIGDVERKTRLDEGVDVIVNDDFQGTYLAAKHLINSGHKRIMYVNNTIEGTSWDIEFLKGYKYAHEEANIVFDEDLIIETGEEYSVENGYKSVKKLLDKSISFNGIICVGEFFMDGAMKAMREKGIRVPEDVSAVCLGHANDMTVVIHDAEELGRKAVERLIERLTNPDWHPERIIVPNKLIANNYANRMKAVVSPS